MKCPECKGGELSLYKVTEMVYRTPITKRKTFSKRKLDNTGAECSQPSLMSLSNGSWSLFLSDGIKRKSRQL
ncbi:hypothetical protein PY093_19220 [Cytobacillus sp. S13-E01]|uniref:hypothetical protein n=1 Tax=Cytobacillus sp. S13-E01 TaxID=3031326 RepID=UPI0023D89819|nr:hypothetical protein [Cytobacillus sp. S13-E01]MDF0728754.1 hypothetical protein [Cytobacillus sp. S13-E01]